MNGENTTSHAQNSVYGKNFVVPFQPLNFTLMPYITLMPYVILGGGGSGNLIEQHLISLASFGGNKFHA
ncbi:hypothetical protein CerSpe_073770 [Prunus speciosa]